MELLNMQADQHVIHDGLPVSAIGHSPLNLNLNDYDISLELARGSRNAL